MTREQLKSFCGTDGGRWNVDQPFAKDGRLWATDTKIAISVLTDEPDDVPKEGKFPPVGEILERYRAKTGKEIALPAALPKPERVKCTECDGLGYFKKCGECDGEGETVCPTCHNEEKCDECDGEGVKPAKTGDACCDCGGTGKQEKIVPVAVGGKSFEAKYLRLIRGLPGLRCRESGPAMLFTADGGVEGLIMSLSW